MKALVVCNTAGLDPDPDKWLKSYISTIDMLKHRKFEVGTLTPYRVGWDMGGKMVWDAAFDGGFDYMINIDDDIWNLPYNAVAKLLDANVDLIGAAVINRHFPYCVTAFNRVNPNDSVVDIWKDGRLDMTEINGTGVQKADMIGFGYTLWRVEAFRKVRHLMYTEINGIPPDNYLCQVCLENGIQPYVHMDIVPNHRHVTPWNAKALYEAEGRYMVRSKSIPESDPRWARLVEMYPEEVSK